MNQSMRHYISFCSIDWLSLIVDSWISHAAIATESLPPAPRILHLVNIATVMPNLLLTCLFTLCTLAVSSLTPFSKRKNGDVALPSYQTQPPVNLRLCDVITSPGLPNTPKTASVLHLSENLQTIIIIIFIYDHHLTTYLLSVRILLGTTKPHH
ncbi:hypothetical protein GOODEAATRI_020255 [Goodea atripinnis]|uniref:Uncharacterized protein n=1 Tax=Goodea atripinnis TaxID=208336 RepID=A0ABV0NW64_9TELE